MKSIRVRCATSHVGAVGAKGATYNPNVALTNQVEEEE